ncbi:MAG: amidohydrolase [Syntrophomonadaceae bacterium]|nr:amidohydrolase [Syntrophomonadaceae bacterium]
MAERLKTELLDWIDNHQTEFIRISKTLWENPELGMEEYRSSALLADTLQQYGFKVARGVADMPTAFIAEYGEGKPVVGLSVEYDCLPGLSQKVATPEYDPVVPGAPGHGCGHNILGVSAALAAIALKQILEAHEIEATLRVFGTPAEEICVGKPFLARDGWFDELDYVLDWHPWYSNQASPCYCSAYFNVKYHFHGQNAHGNSPWYGRSALDAAIWSAHAIEILREHIRPEEESSANTINYSFSDVGPEIPNVVPERSTLWCIGRFKTSKEMQEAVARIDKCAEAGALATGTTLEREFISASREMIPNRIMAEVLYRNLRALGTVAYSEEEQDLVKAIQWNSQMPATGLPREILEPRECGSGLTDSAEYSWKAPYASFNLAVAPGDGWHNWRVTTCVGSSIGMKAMVHAAKLLALANMEVIQNPGLVESAQAELAARLKGQAYVELIGREVKPPVMINREAMEKYSN